MHPRPHALRLGVTPLLLLAAGCTEPRNVGNLNPSLGPAPPIETTDASQPAPGPKPEPSQGGIIGQRTTDIRRAEPELQKGARIATTRITATDPVTLPGNAYVTMIGRTSILQIEEAMRLFQAMNDRYPKDYDEFMTEIIKANNIALPKLPDDQEYGYDEKEHTLIILRPRRVDTTHHP
ncbi:MAG: hypothetical protein JOZ53_26805 [Planctomycetaceae bacterium]|nr:hypothetical protein [Planctomycetaceae bacterium]